MIVSGGRRISSDIRGLQQTVIHLIVIGDDYSTWLHFSSFSFPKRYRRRRKTDVLQESFNHDSLIKSSITADTFNFSWTVESEVSAYQRLSDVLLIKLHSTWQATAMSTCLRSCCQQTLYKGKKAVVPSCQDGHPYPLQEWSTQNAGESFLKSCYLDCLTFCWPLYFQLKIYINNAMQYVSDELERLITEATSCDEVTVTLAEALLEKNRSSCLFQKGLLCNITEDAAARPELARMLNKPTTDVDFMMRSVHLFYIPPSLLSLSLSLPLRLHPLSPSPPHPHPLLSVSRTQNGYLSSHHTNKSGFHFLFGKPVNDQT